MNRISPPRDGRIRKPALSEVEGSSQAKRGGLRGKMSSIARVIEAILKEIFDESAYQRFLDRSRLQSSPNAYAIFRQENDQAKSQRPRCC